VLSCDRQAGWMFSVEEITIFLKKVYISFTITENKNSTSILDRFDALTTDITSGSPPKSRHKVICNAIEMKYLHSRRHDCGY
jgi:hypothetical protein